MRPPRRPIAPVCAGLRTAYSCATIWACRWRSRASTPKRSNCCALWSTSRAKARNRQNLALAYGLAGDLTAAERISQLDLDEESVENNLSYFAALAAVEDRRKRASALGVHPPELTDEPADVDASRRIAAIALEGEGLELGLAPTGRWFVDLGEYGSPERASSAWRELRVEHKDLLGHLSRLAGVENGRQPLLVGPLAGAEQAQSLCGNLERRGQRCRALPL